MDWYDRYIQIRNWIAPYLGGRIRLHEVDVLCIWAFVDMMNNKKDSFIILDRKNRYAFHIPSGYLLHIFGSDIFHFIKKKFGQKIIQRVIGVEAGRKIVYGERVIPGPRGGKLFALGSATHVSTHENEIRNPLTKQYLLKMKYYVKQHKIQYPHIYKAEKKAWYKPFDMIMKEIACKTLYPGV